MPDIRHQGEILEVSQDCEIGQAGERCVVVYVTSHSDGRRFMLLSFPSRVKSAQNVRTGTDYLHLRRIATAGEAEA